ncbi:MAG: VWA domain-containing protein [Acidobacteria bacterium]|nr:VWA domain-containing protein [Acidobacteriota bacterium]
MKLAIRLALALWLATAAAVALEIRIMVPPAGEVLLGEVEVVAEVIAERPPRFIELIVDGQSAGRLDRGPYRWIVDLGDRTAPHSLEVRGEDAEGRPSSSVLESPGVRVDSEIEVELVPLYVTVTRDGAAIETLERGDFTLLDDGRREKIVTFERGDVPLTAVLLLDVSESMQGRQLEGALAGVRAFIDGMQSLDQAMLLLFSDQVQRATPFTGFPELLRAGLEGVTAEGGTAVNDHLYLALELLAARRGRRVIVLLSDGLDSASVLAMKDVLSTGRRGSTLIYWLRLPLTAGQSFSSAWRGASEHRREMADLERAVRRSGGQIVTLGRIDEALVAFEHILAELRGQYVLGYYPTVDRDDGSWHRVRVRVAQPGVEVRYRDGYVDD